ncbi:Mo25-like [Musa troglodytarum]|uniref:Mo25-like n=1 Tax=Musa troglodytarum TaxID=320322 RepID=A0A9E7JG47_9LILI|nr:Mo25-like [Musa troglodytarum]
MSFLFKSSPRPKPTPAELANAIKESFLALDTNTFAKVVSPHLRSGLDLLALEEVQKNILSMRQMLSGDGEVEPNEDHISQLAVEICKGDVLALFIHKLPTLNWEARKDLVYCWSSLLMQNCCVEYIENNLELVDFLVICYNNKEIALSCGNMLRECIKYPTLAKCILESNSFELFFKYVELPNFDIASDALATFKDLLIKHETVVSEFLISHYEQFFELYEKLLTSPNYVTRRQSLKDTSKNIQISAFHIFKVFVANPNKPREIINVLIDKHEELLMSLQNLPMSKGEDDQFEEEKDLVIKEIEKLSGL